MAADGNLLKGEVSENPSTNEGDVERLLLGFVRALLAEQKGGSATPAAVPSPILTRLAGVAQAAPSATLAEGSSS